MAETMRKNTCAWDVFCDHIEISMRIAEIMARENAIKNKGKRNSNFDG